MPNTQDNTLNNHATNNHNPNSILDLDFPPPSLADFDTSGIDKTARPFVLVDGSYYLFRCFHGLPALSNSQGLPTNAIRGVLNALNKLINTHKPTHMVVAFDTKAPTFRHDMSQAYKANRPKMPDELAVQIPYIHTLIQKMNIPLIALDGYEADDIIGTLALNACQNGHRVLISTGDKDMAQLVNEAVVLEDSFKGKITDYAGVIDKFGVRPNQIIDYLTLMGDASDGISGVPKVGAKTATTLLTTYDNIQNIIDNADNIKGVVGDNIKKNTQTIAMDKKLATIMTNLSLPYAWDDLRLDDSKQDWQGLLSLFSELEFTKEMKQVQKQLSNTLVQPQKLIQPTNTAVVDVLPPKSQDYQIIDNKQDFERLVATLATKTVFAIDTETTSKHWQNADLVGISISYQAGTSFYIPLAHTDDLGIKLPNQLATSDVLTALKPLLENPCIQKIGQHLKYDCHILGKLGIDLLGQAHTLPDNWAMDTMLASYVINASATRHNMDDLAKHYLGVQTTSFEDIAGKGVKQLSFDKIALDVASAYACEDADITYRLYELFSGLLKDDATAQTLLHRLEIPVAKILANMEKIGILIDKKFLIQLSSQFDRQLQLLENTAFELSGEPFNLASPKQLGEILFEKLQLQGGKKTKTGQYSTSEEILSTLDHPLVDTVLEHRSISKLKSTYTDALVKALDSQNRVHTSYHQALTSTGRLSSTDPNLQNIPIRSELGRQIREGFIAPQGRVIVSADYSQIELRLMAHFSNDQSLINAFKNNEDIHKITASEILNKPVADITNDERRSAKAVNFGLLYGMSSFGLAKQLGVPRAVASDYIKRYFARYPTIYDYMENTKNQAITHGYVKTILGRKIFAPDVAHKNRAVKEGALRAAINAPLQGSAADIIKLAMIGVDKMLPKDKASLLLQVHDELVFEIDENEAITIAEHIKTAMQNVLTDTAYQMGIDVNFVVPLLVEIGIGKNWGEAH